MTPETSILRAREPGELVLDHVDDEPVIVRVAVRLRQRRDADEAEQAEKDEQQPFQNACPMPI